MLNFLNKYTLGDRHMDCVLKRTWKKALEAVNKNAHSTIDK